MTESKPVKTDFWEKVGWMWPLIFYTTLIFSAILAWSESDKALAQKWQIGTLTVLFALWYAAFAYYTTVYLAEYDRQRYRGPSLIYLTITIVFWFTLTTYHPAFNFVLFSLYAQIFSYSHLRWSIPISIILSGLAAYLQLREPDSPSLSLDNPWLWYFFFASAAGIALALYIEGIVSQSVQRRELIEQLQATRTELAGVERREGMLQERARLAREIHDTLAQSFISIITHLEAGEQHLAENVAQSQHHLTQAKEMARQGVNEARRVVQALRPEVLEKAPLPEAIERVVQGWGQQSDTRTSTTVTGTPLILHPEAETTLVRAVQEALANVQKHAHATAVQVTLSYMGDVLMLDVQDDGMGLDQATPPTNGSGYGLTAMRQRVTQLGGSLTIESEPDEGTTVVVQLPLRQ